jgi:hypothetical protein
MTPELIPEFDAALLALEAAAAPYGSTQPLAGGDESGRVADGGAGQAAGSPPESISGPLARLEVFECLRRSAEADVREAERLLPWLAVEIDRLRTAGADPAPLHRREDELRRHRAALRDRLEGQRRRILEAREGVARLLAGALQQVADAVVAGEDRGSSDLAERARGLLAPMEAYCRILRAATPRTPAATGPFQPPPAPLRVLAGGLRP